jgi:phosphatidylglycerol:prolipoprotein diacylglycerol transferase
MNFLLKNYFTIFGIDIYYYAVCIVTGMILASVIAGILCKRRGLPYDIIIDMLLWVIPFSIVGARAYYVLTSLSEFHTFAEVINIRSGGLAIYGGIIGGAIAVAIVCRIKKLNFIKFADCAVVALILGQVIGRWGNYINGEAYGNIITNPEHYGLPWSVNVDGIYYQATFFYESFWNFVGFIGLFLFAWLYRNKVNGLVMCAYFVWYGIGRAVIEGLRSDSLYIGDTGIRISQLLSVILIFFGIGLAIYLIISYKKKQFALISENEEKIEEKK